jgi:glucosamine-phosphate N-acetyltransferase
MYSLRKLETCDYNKGYLKLLETLTVVNSDIITLNLFDEFVKKLHLNHVVYVIEHMNQIIATGTILIEHKLIHGCGKVGHIEDIVVSPEYKGKKLGSLIIKFLIKYAKDLDCYKVILDCKDDIIQFYDKCGFERKGSQMSLYLN